MKLQKRKKGRVLSILLAMMLVVGGFMPTMTFASDVEMIPSDGMYQGAETENLGLEDGKEDETKSDAEADIIGDIGEADDAGGVGETGDGELRDTADGDLAGAEDGANDGKEESREEDHTEEESEKEIAMPQMFAFDGEPVKILGMDESFGTLKEALNAANNAGLNNFTIEITGDVIEGESPTIDANVTLISGSGTHTIQLRNAILVQNGGKLTLGDGTTENVLTLDAASGGTAVAVSVTDGTVLVRDGIVLISNSTATRGGALSLLGANAVGTIGGGSIRGHVAAITVDGGARITEISGGEFEGRNNALYLAGLGSRIDLISDGKFYQRGVPDNANLHGHGIFIDNNATIGEISGGYIETERNTALSLIRGAYVGEISGGEFYATRLGTRPDQTDWNSAVRVSGERPLARIDTISGGHFHGTNIGVLVIREPNFDMAEIGRITGGKFEGTRALQNDFGGFIGEITGGEIIGTSIGLLNAGEIEYIGGNVAIRSSASTAIWNFRQSESSTPFGVIKEIGGGTITSASGTGITNAGTIELISGGRIEGTTAINNNGNPAGRLLTITGGTFWGRTFRAINVAAGEQFRLTLEPGLDARIGFARFRSAGDGEGDIFNDDSRVNFPGEYFMSPINDTLSVAGISGAEFRFLRLSTVDYEVTVNESYADITGAGFYEEGETVTIDAGKREGFVFIGWTTSDGVELGDPNSAKTTFVMPAHDVTITANWKIEEKPGGGDNGDKPGGDDNGGNNGGGGGSGGDDGVPPIVKPEPPSPFTDDHIWYVRGYPDGGVKPEKSITRAEIAMILFRLIEDEAKYASQSSYYSDVEFGSWYAEAVNYLSNIAIVSGYPDGTFRPNAPISRAELAAVMSRFFEISGVSADAFVDVSSDHWAYNYINNAHNKGWVIGYGDKTYRPDAATSRAEAVTLLNRVLGRKPKAESVKSKLYPFLEENFGMERLFNDIDEIHWSYYQFMEAATTHDFTRDAQDFEDWKEIEIPWLSK